MERNVELLQQTMQYILDHPKEHDQSAFVNTCGTAACFAGRAALLSGWTVHQITWAPMWAEGAALLGLTLDEAMVLFAINNTVPMMELMVKDLVNGDPLRRQYRYRSELSYWPVDPWL